MMRVSTSFQYDTYTENIRRAQSNYFDAQQKVSSGKRFTKVSEDPVAALTSLSARSLRSRLEQLTKNLDVAKEYTGTTENVLGEVGSLLKSALTYAIQGASDTSTNESRQALAEQVSSIQKRIVELGNTRGTGGKYIFAGQSIDTKPFSASSGALVFSGDTNPIQVEVRPGETMQANLPNADAFFGDVYSKLERLRTDLLGSDATTISNVDVQAMNDAIDKNSLVRGQNGVLVQQIDRLSTENARRSDDLTKTISDNEDIDIAEAITKMQQAEMAYTASLQVATKGFSLSLMDFLK
ncbi:MAG TPA: flagellar hook-associated protein FlgL [Fimbriimonadaceae bacterium]|nr:flagellar hook-associated protein FlgL [Fimbriimonadaceae bacterium]